jgi:FMN reductase
LAVRLLAAVAELVAAPDEHVVIDLAESLATLGAPLGPDSARRYAGPLAALTSARFAVVATPTYKGSYTGLLKSFLDHVAAGQLRGVVAVPVMTVGSPAHTLAAEVHLRPLLVELGAVIPAAALVVGEDRLTDPAAAVADWVAVAAPALRALLADPDGRRTGRAPGASDAGAPS